MFLLEGTDLGGPGSDRILSFILQPEESLPRAGGGYIC